MISCQHRLQLHCCKEPPGTCVPAVPKRRKVDGRGSHVDFAARAFLLRLVDETEGYEGGGVGIVGCVQVDGMGGDPNVGIFGKIGSVGEGERMRVMLTRKKWW